MKRLQLVALLLVLAARPSLAAIAFVSASVKSQCSVVSGGSASLALPASTTAGNDVVVLVAFGDGRVVSSITDGGSTYAERVPMTGTALFGESAVWSARGVTASSSIVVNWSPTTTSTVCLMALEYSGVAALGTTSVTTSSLSGSLTTQDANNFIVAGILVDMTATGITGTFAADVGNLRASTPTEVGNKIGQAGCDNTVASPGTVSCSVTYSGAPDDFQVLALELRSVAPIGASPTPTRQGGTPLILRPSGK